MVTTLLRTDIAIQAPNGALVALIELKNREGLTADISIALRNPLVRRGLLDGAPYFLMLSQDHGYLWSQGTAQGATGEDAPPTFDFPMHPVMRRYWPDFNPDERLRGAQLNFIVTQWLYDLAADRLTGTDEPEATLAHSGLLANLRNAEIVSEIGV